MTTPLKIAVIIGSTRKKRFSEHPAKWIFEELEKRQEIRAELLDLRDYPMPFFEEEITPSMIKEDYAHPVVKQWSQKIREQDGYVLVTPEYNHSVSAVLKNALDYVYHAWNRKPVAFVSWGSVMGARSVEHLRAIAIELQMAPLRNAVHIPAFWTLIDEQGSLKEGAFEPQHKAAGKMIDDLLWWGMP